uniref:Integrase catalytic domain-containing protein n=1 Tax=Cannabis sativa TaxID=3483 RepID=A0A803PJ67_CANSA
MKALLQDALLGEKNLPAGLTEKEKTELLDKAHSAIILSLGDKVLKEISKEESAVGVWKKLESLYMKKSLANRLFLKQKLYSFKMTPGKEIEDHLDDFNKVILDLENIGIKGEDENQAIIVLNSLPTESYEHFVDTMTYGRESLTLEEVQSALMSKEMKRKVDKQDDNASEGLFVRGKGSKKENSDQSSGNKDKSNAKLKRICFLCNKISHLKKDYPILKDYISKKNGNADVVSDGDDSDGYDIASVLKQFINYRTVNSGTVKLGYNHSCPIVGIGSAKLQMTGDGVTMLEHGNTFRNQVNTVAPKGEEPTLIWHRRLSHISYGGLKILSKLRVFGKDQIHPMELCEQCILWKATKVKFGIGKHTTKGIVDYLHSDLWGPSRTKSRGGARNPQQNGLTERMNRTILERVRCMLIYAGLPKSFWAEIAFTAYYLINRCPSSAIEFKTPVEVWKGKPRKLTRDRNRRATRSPVRFGFADVINYALSIDAMGNEERATYEEAMQSDDKLEHKDGIPGVEKTRFKARVVTRGFSQRKGVDYNEIFSSVVKHTSIRLMLSIVAINDLELEQLDVNTTFLHGDLEENILVKQLKGFGFNQAKPVKNPCPPLFKLSKSQAPIDDEDANYMNRVPYSSVVGSLMYLMICTIPNISYGVSMVSKFMGQLGKEH